MHASYAPVLIRSRIADGVLALLAIAVISLMVLPLPAALLDGLIAVNIALSILLLMMAMYVNTPLALSTFPALLLFTTLLRLSLNIASTRSILLHGHAGQIIDTFGKLVVGGNVAVGIVVFLIIAIVQFIVIAKGAERVAEVGARFTLDALPGKQMSIEVELRAGTLDKDESQNKRQQLSRESQWYGAMDGAMKFVKGDAIAGLLIAAVNIVAGISIAVAMNGLPFAQALATYTILTIGDGLVSQIPSLFVSLAAGVLVTRVGRDSAGAESNLAGEISAQLAAQPKALALTAVVLFLFLAVPGFPKWQFLFWAVALAACALALQRLRRRDRDQDPMRSALLQRDGLIRQRSSADFAGSLVASFPVCLRLAAAHRSAVDRGEVAAGIQDLREQITQRLGVPFPGVHLILEPHRPDDAFTVLVNDVPVSQSNGDCDEVLRALGRALTRYAPDFIGLQETRDLLTETALSFPDLVAEANKVVPTARLTAVLRRLVEEGLSIRNQRDILQAMIEWSPKEKDPVLLTEHVRQALTMQIGWLYGGTGKTLRAVSLSASAEEQIRSAIKMTAQGSFLALAPEVQSTIADQICAAIDRSGTISLSSSISDSNSNPIVITSMDIRRYVKRLLDARRAGVTVLSYQELGADISLLPLATVPAAAVPPAAVPPATVPPAVADIAAP